LVTGIAYEIENNSTGTLTVNSSGGNLVGTIPAGVCAHAVCIGTTLTTAADWDWDYISTTTITGTGANVLGTSPTITTPTISSLSSAAATALTLQSAGTTAVTIDTSQNVGIGTTSPATKLNAAISAANETTSALRVTNLNTSGYGVGIEFSDEFSVSGRVAARIATNTPINGPTADLYFQTRTASALTEKMRIASTGNVGIGTASAYANIQAWVGTDTNGSTGQGGASIQGGSSGNIDVGHASGTSSGANYERFIYNASVIGSITQNGTTGVLYNLTSDYRLKNNPVALTGAKDFVMALQPKTWDWWDDSGKGVGFIAHEFMEVAKYSGNGEKDASHQEEYEVTPAVKDEEGNITTPAVMGTRTVADYQSIQPSSSEVMANLVAFIQEQQATITALTARITALENA
jgi:hypothetical protein